MSDWLGTVGGVGGVMLVGAFGYVTWRLAVTKAARETIGLLQAQIAALEHENSSLRGEIQELRRKVEVLSEAVTSAAAVQQLAERIDKHHENVMHRLDAIIVRG